MKQSRQKTLFHRLQQLFPKKEKDWLYSRILCGEVLVDGGRIKDPKFAIKGKESIEIQERFWVSRGGPKLWGALKHLHLNWKGLVVLDAGSSTGGFVQASLNAGAQLVHAVDVGKGQLDQSLRKDRRVNNLEGTNILSLKSLAPPPDIATADLSFRGLAGVAGKIVDLTKMKALLALVKPQFELEGPPSGFDGVIRDPQIVLETLILALGRLQKEGLELIDWVASSLKGRKGNQEFFFLLKSKRESFSEISSLVSNDAFDSARDWESEFTRFLFPN